MHRWDPKVAKTKVSNPKRNSLSKLRLVHAPLKRLIQTRPNMSTSRCGNVCVKNIWKDGVVSVTAVVLMQLSGRRCVFLCESKSTLFGLPKVDAIRNHWLRFVYNTTAQPKCLNLYNAFYGRQFSEPSRVQGWLCKKAISKKKKKKKVNSDFAMTICRFWISDCKYVLLLVQVFAIDCSNVEFCA